MSHTPAAFDPKRLAEAVPAPAPVPLPPCFANETIIPTKMSKLKSFNTIETLLYSNSICIYRNHRNRQVLPNHQIHQRDAVQRRQV